ncbi:FUSC family protein [Streptomyces sp. N2-109]|uniref:FUSC family protein n=1 Tax=Streptomyces gossypii TaxID=2883101 RepID=A0ABT2JTE1_9ACTN|nr:FUSC family protein [Streptomyces gossypii]MCT2591026.1 FUSC family protein [Streptomyces gossypii]
MSWRRALRETARSGLRVERTSLTPFLAIRGACGVALTVGLALYFGGPTLAVSCAFGAFASGTATFQRSWRPRPVLALGAAAGLALSTFVGYLCVPWDAAFLALLAVWAFAAGMAWATGPTSGVVASLTVAVMLVAVTLPTSVLGALGHAALIAVGGLVQAALIELFPVRPWGERRDTLADALAGVADYARRLRHDPRAAFDPEPLMEARDAAAVTRREARRRPRQLQGYRALAERFRPVLASLADPVVGGVPSEGPERDRVRALLAAAGTVLDATARAIRRGEPVRIPEDALAVLQVPESGPVLSGPARKTAIRLIALTDDTVEAAQEPVEVTRSFPMPRAVGSGWQRVDPSERPLHLHRPSVPGLLPVALRALRRELRWSSPILRHALRLAVVVPLCRFLGELLPPEHGYWVALTAVMVLRPDFSQTFERGVARFVGTLAGVVIAGSVTALTSPGPYVSAALAVCSIGMMYLLMSAGYIIVSACTAAYVIFLLGIAGSEWAQTVPERVWLTAVGGLVAMLSYALFPTWETPRLRDRLADWLNANGRYATAVFDAFAYPENRHPRQVRDALLDVRASRTAWDQAAGRAGAEPVRHRGVNRRAARDAQLALVTMGRVTMLLEAHLPDPKAKHSSSAAEPSLAAKTSPAAVYARALAESMGAASEALRAGAPLDWSRVHDALEAWQSAEDALSPVELRAADLLTDALDELAEALVP